MMVEIGGNGGGFKISPTLLIFLVVQGAAIIWAASALNTGLNEVEKDIADIKAMVGSMPATDREQDVRIERIESFIEGLYHDARPALPP